MSVTNIHRPPYAMISYTLLRDERLTWKARGVLSYMLTMADNWQFYTDELASHGPDGVKAVRSALNELIRLGYLVKQKQRDTNGRLTVSNWNVYDQPHDQNGNVVETPLNWHSQNGDAYTPVFLPHSQNRHVVESPTEQHSENANIDIPALSPRAGLRHAANGTLSNNNSKNYQEELTTSINNAAPANSSIDLYSEPDPERGFGGGGSPANSLTQLRDEWQENAGVWSGVLKTDVLADLDELQHKHGLSEPDAVALIKTAMQETTRSANTGVPSPKLLNTILTRYEKTGTLTPEAVAAHEEQFNAAKSSPGRGYSKAADPRNEVYHDSVWAEIDARYAAEDAAEAAAKAKKNGGEVDG